MEQASESDLRPAWAQSRLADGRASRGQELPRAALAVGLTALIFGLADLTSSLIVIVAALAGPVVLLAILVVGVTTTVAIIAVVRALTGRRVVVGPIVATVLAATVGAIALGGGALTPFPAEPATPAMHVLICVGSALFLGFFIGPTPFRALGGLAGTGILISVLAVTAGTATQESTADDANREVRIESFERYLTEGTHPLTTDNTQWNVARVEWQGRTTFSSPSGGLVTVVVEPPNERSAENLDAYVCMRLLQLFTGESDASAPLDSWTDRCEKTADSWAVSGTGLAWVSNTTFVFATQSMPYLGNEPEGQIQPADLGEIEELRPHLRPMSEAELREAFSDEWLGPEL